MWHPLTFHSQTSPVQIFHQPASLPKTTSPWYLMTSCGSSLLTRATYTQHRKQTKHGRWWQWTKRREFWRSSWLLESYNWDASRITGLWVIPQTILSSGLFFSQDHFFQIFRLLHLASSPVGSNKPRSSHSWTACVQFSNPFTLHSSMSPVTNPRLPSRVESPSNSNWREGPIHGESRYLSWLTAPVAMCTICAYTMEKRRHCFDQNYTHCLCCAKLAGGLAQIWDMIFM